MQLSNFGGIVLSKERYECFVFFLEYFPLSDRVIFYLFKTYFVLFICIHIIKDWSKPEFMVGAEATVEPYIVKFVV